MSPGVELVARAKTEPPRDDVAVKVDRNIVKKARAVCGMREITLAEYLSSLLAVPVERDWQASYSENEGKPKGRSGR